MFGPKLRGKLSAWIKYLAKLLAPTFYRTFLLDHGAVYLLGPIIWPWTNYLARPWTNYLALEQLANPAKN